MTKAALYARVSTDAQQKEGTIESQLVELRRQIAVAGQELAAEYIDDGYTGMVLDRPALNRMRADLKTDGSTGSIFLLPIASLAKLNTSGSSSVSFLSTASRSRSTARTTCRTPRTS
jgi:DNA invertase Pin-like site-specific DNA recombinase